MKTKIELVPSQVCFERDGYMFCNWVHAKEKGYVIVSNAGKYLRFMIIPKKEEEKQTIITNPQP